MSTQQVKRRNAKTTKSNILKAAKQEFSQHGFSGARVDVIASESDANKRMLYHYFGNKESLFLAVLEEAYLDIRRAEQALSLDDLSATQALEAFVRFTWDYYLENPEFITLVNNENLHQAKHIRQLKGLPETTRGLVDMVQDILDRGVKSNEFRPNINASQLNITIAAIGYYYLTNRHTSSFLFEQDLMSQSALEARLAFNIETILRLVRRDDNS